MLWVDMGLDRCSRVPNQTWRAKKMVAIRKVEGSLFQLEAVTCHEWPWRCVPSQLCVGAGAWTSPMQLHQASMPWKLTRGKKSSDPDKLQIMGENHVESELKSQYGLTQIKWFRLSLGTKSLIESPGMWLGQLLLRQVPCRHLWFAHCLHAAVYPQAQSRQTDAWHTSSARKHQHNSRLLHSSPCQQGVT